MDRARALPAFVVALGVALVLLGLQPTARGAWFAVGLVCCLVGYCLLARSFRKPPSPRSIHDAVMIGELDAGVREHDRPLRSGTWLTEYVMRDSAPRRVIGWVAVALIAPAFSVPAFYLFGGAMAASPAATSAGLMAVAFGFGALLVRWGRQDEREARSRDRREYLD